MDLVLYVYIHEKLHPVSLFTKSICKLVNIPLKVVQSKYPWTCVGDLPNLKLNQFLYPSHRIIQVLKQIINIEEELEPEKLIRNKLIEESLYTKLHPGTLFLSSCLVSPSDKFLSIFKGIQKFIDWNVKLSLDECSGLSFSNEKQVIRAFEETYGILTQALMGNELFSNSKNGLGLSCIDLIVYSYLKEHLFYLETLTNIQENIENHPRILKFIVTVEEILCKHKVNTNVLLDSNFLASLAFKQENQVELKQKDPHKENRKLFVTSVAFIFASYLLITTS